MESDNMQSICHKQDFYKGFACNLWIGLGSKTDRRSWLDSRPEI